MNRKANPFVSLIALVLMAAILLAVLCNCEPAETSAAEPARFKLTHKENTGGWIIRIFTDTETGAQYLLVGDSTGYGEGYGLTVLQPGTAEPEEVPEE